MNLENVDKSWKREKSWKTWKNLKTRKIFLKTPKILKNVEKNLKNTKNLEKRDKTWKTRKILKKPQKILKNVKKLSDLEQEVIVDNRQSYKMGLEGLRDSYFTPLFAAPYLGLLTNFASL